MKVLFCESIVSPHQLPFCDAMVNCVGEGNFCYCATKPLSEERRKLGWLEARRNYIVRAYDGISAAAVEEYADRFDVLLTWILEPRLIYGFISRGKRVFYASERYFKPPYGMLGRLPFPEKLKRMILAESLMRKVQGFTYLPVGIHAARDMARLCGLMHGDLKCLVGAPKLDFRRKPGGEIWLKDGENVKRYCLDKMRLWGYYVSPSENVALPVQEAGKSKPQEVKLLWVGRLLNLKRVDVIVRAVGEHANLKRVDDSLPKITLDIYGTGPAEKILKKMAAEYGDLIRFHPPVPISEVRHLMQEHDVYVLASNGYEGWGAVVSEALEEGMKVIGTYEAGSSATMLPKDCLYHSGDVSGLHRILEGYVCSDRREESFLWSAGNAAETFLEMCD